MTKNDKIKILERRINYIVSAVVATVAIIFSFLSLIINFDGKSVLFLVLKNETVFTAILFIEIVILFWGYRLASKYFREIEKLEGIKGNEDFLK